MSKIIKSYHKQLKNVNMRIKWNAEDKPLYKALYTWVWLPLWLIPPLPMQETQVFSQGWEDPLEKRMATHSNILAWQIPWTGEPGGATVHGIARVGDNLATKPTNQKKINSPTIIWAKDKINQFRGMSNPMSTCKSMFKHTCSKEGKLNFAIKWAKSKW